MNAHLVTRNLNNRRFRRWGICPFSIRTPADSFTVNDATKWDVKEGITWVGTDDYGRGIEHGPDADTDPEPFVARNFYIPHPNQSPLARWRYDFAPGVDD